MTEHDTDDAKAFESQLNHALGNADVIHREMTEHIPAPAGDAPRLETYFSNDYDGIIVAERDGGMDSGAWIECEQPVDVREMQ